MTHTSFYNSPIGSIALTSDGTALTGLRFLENIEHIENLDNIENINAARRWLNLYFSGQAPDFLPPLNLKGTPFQCRVWQALMEIPYGQTTTYGELARHIGCRSAQAVGQAVGRNPVAIIVPCHRVVGSDGSLVGYEWGLEKKQYLLHLEQAY
ncbi:MAG: methylated-DNA--[protein]-cysteine S-methyltransferase [Bacteroidales bacterium]|nr:methylated-DNA--[protein]-cysteine S-methyltransferase [Bacteroidales bacterium]